METFLRACSLSLPSEVLVSLCCCCFFLSDLYFPLLPGLLLFSYSITLFHLTLPRRKGMQMQIGPIVFNCMHWWVAAQLKCFKCLCLGLKHRGSWHLRQGGPVTTGSSRSNKPTPGCNHWQEKDRRPGKVSEWGPTARFKWVWRQGLGSQMRTTLKTGGKDI